MGVAALASAALSVVTIGAESAAPGLDPGLGIGRQRRGKGQNNLRGRGAQAKPKKRSNRLIISKRVRRKHRRARA